MLEYIPGEYVQYFIGGKLQMIKKNSTLFILLLLLIFMTILIPGCNTVEPRINLAEVTEIDILILESFPVQVHVVASGYLPNPCTQIYEIIQSREGNDFTVTIKTETSPGSCFQVIEPFEEILL
jgi:hypothetical protein